MLQRLGRRRVAANQIDCGRLMHQRARHLGHPRRKRRREEQRLARAGRRALAEQVLDVVLEAAVEHGVGFVQHGQANARQRLQQTRSESDNNETQVGGCRYQRALF